MHTFLQTCLKILLVHHLALGGIVRAAKRRRNIPDNPNPITNLETTKELGQEQNKVVYLPNEITLVQNYPRESITIQTCM